jgi:hypothetical protein
MDFKQFLFTPSEKKEQLGTNFIKPAHLQSLQVYMPAILEKTREKNKVIFIKVEGKESGYLWYVQPSEFQPPNVFVPKCKINKIQQDKLKINQNHIVDVNKKVIL